MQIDRCDPYMSIVIAGHSVTSNMVPMYATRLPKVPLIPHAPFLPPVPAVSAHVPPFAAWTSLSCAILMVVEASAYGVQSVVPACWISRLMTQEI